MNRMQLRIRSKVVILAASIAGSFMFQSCSDSKSPDVSGIKADITLHRFDQAEFSADTSNVIAALKELNAKFPFFANDFNTLILGIHPISDTLSLQEQQAFRFFLSNYRPVFDSLKAATTNLSTVKKELDQAFKHIKYYFPSYQIPEITTYVGPFDAPGVAITDKTIAIGLQLFGGSDFFFYQTQQGQAMYPQYISRRFEPAYIHVNVTKAVIDDLYPGPQEGTSLIDQIVEGGKQWHLLDLLLPTTEDSLKTGYTAKQLEFCRENEAAIWNLIMTSSDLYTVDPETIRMYIGEAPNTEAMTEASPGNIGQWVGRQIIRKYISKHSDLAIDSLMKTDNRKIFQETGYKPK